MSATEKQYHAGTTTESTVTQKSSMTPVLLSPKDVAGRLGVCERTAKRSMMELPHILVSMDLYCRKKRVRITEETFDNFARGIITRKRLRRAG